MERKSDSSPKPMPPSGPPKVLSAARAVPIAPPKPQGPLTNRLKEEALNVTLNASSVMEERWTRFLQSNRFFKYKVLIVASWLGLGGLGIWVAGRDVGAAHAESALGARLLPADPTKPPVYTVENESEQAWSEATLVVNGVYKGRASGISPHDFMTLTPKQLVDVKGARAPPDLQAHDIVLYSGGKSTVLMKDGEPQ